MLYMFKLHFNDKKIIPYMNFCFEGPIPFVWNLITAGYIEQSIYGVVASTLCLLIMGKLLEQVWGPKEFLKFIFIANFLISVCVFITAISLYYITRRENYLGSWQVS
uniref:Uncharacterized protein n=1 Tax=Salix viminalis TaxID=40686 RepID=A0A6N2M5Z9_SALVM